MSVSARDEILKLQPFGKQIDFLLKTKTNIWVYHNAYLFIAINAIILNAHTKAEYSSWFSRFMITPSAMDSFLKIWEKFCDFSNLGSRIVARIDWGVCICAIISGVVKLPLPLKTPALARTAKPSSVNETQILPDTFLPMFVHTACPPRYLSTWKVGHPHTSWDASASNSPTFFVDICQSFAKCHSPSQGDLIDLG